MKYIILLFGLLITPLLFAQIEVIPIEDVIIENAYPEGVYRTYRSFKAKQPNSRKRVEARNVFKSKEKINDQFIDNCYFYYTRTNKRVKDAFAISYNGSLYLHVKSIKKMMEGKDKRQSIDFKDSFLRVVDQGKYLYAEGYFSKGGGIGLGIGMGVGIGGGIGGGGINNGFGRPQEELKGLVFDFDREIFELFRDCPDLRDWLDEYHPNSAIDCDGRRLPVEFLREMIFEVNAQ